MPIFLGALLVARGLPYAALVAAGLLSVLLFPLTALRLLRNPEGKPAKVLEDEPRPG